MNHFARHARVTLALARAYLTARYERSALGALWYLVAPVATFFVFYSFHASVGLGDPQVYVLPLAVGVACFSYFRTSTTVISNAFASSAGLLRNVSVSPIAVLAARALEALVAHVAEIVLVLILALALGAPWWGIVAYLPGLALFTIVASCVGATLAFLSTYASDARLAWSYVVTLALFCAPIFLDVPADRRPWFMDFNPLTNFVDASRAAFVHGSLDITALGALALWAIGTSAIVAICNRVWGKGMIERL